MKKIFTLLLLAFSFNVSANLISIDVSDDLLAVGDTVTVNILASDFAPTDVFNFNLDFDTSLFSYDASSLESDLYSSNPFAIYEINNYIGYFAFSFLDFGPVIASDYVLASFELTAVVAGYADFTFSNVAFYQDSFWAGTLLSVDSSSSASSQIVDVPEPQTWLLLLLALPVVFRRKKVK